MFYKIKVVSRNEIICNFPGIFPVTDWSYLIRHAFIIDRALYLCFQESFIFKYQQNQNKKK